LKEYLSEIIASVALIVSFLSYQIAKKTQRLSELDYSEKNKSVKAYLIDSFMFSAEEKKYCSFAISYTNQSSTPKSFSSLELMIEFYDQEGILGKAISDPIDIQIAQELMGRYQRLKVPVNLMPKETISGWVTFDLPLSTKRKFRIESYHVIGKYEGEQKAIVNAYLIRKVKNAQEN
jgi:hypothetical protein